MAIRMNDHAPQVRVLSKEEADAFRLFERHRMIFDALLKGGVFDAPPTCKIEMNLHNAQVQNIYIHTQTYRRDKGGE